MSEEQEDYECTECRTDYTREKYPSEEYDRHCQCCDSGNHFIDPYDIELSQADLEKSEPVCITVDVHCRYCDADLTIQFDLRAGAYDNEKSEYISKSDKGISVGEVYGSVWGNPY